jgi:hypothetical protein
MKNWAITIALGPALGLALGAAAGCQNPAPSSTVEQAQTAAADDCYGVANYCQATKPALSSWTTGEPFPQSTPTTVVVVIRRSAGAVWEAYGADPVIGAVLWGRSMKPTALPAFLNLADGGAHAYGGVRPPVGGVCPPECGEPLPGYLLEAARRIAPIQAQAQAAEDACFP